MSHISAKFPVPAAMDSRSLLPLCEGNTDADWDIVDNNDGTFNVWVRAERSGKGIDRTYIITATATDCANNETIEVGSVVILHNRGKKK